MSDELYNARLAACIRKPTMKGLFHLGEAVRYRDQNGYEFDCIIRDLRESDESDYPYNPGEIFYYLIGASGTFISNVRANTLRSLVRGGTRYIGDPTE